MAFAPLEGHRHIKVTSHRAKTDYAHFSTDLSDKYFTNAEKIVLVQDDLKHRVDVGQKEHNKQRKIANWQFTNENVRTKLVKLSPSI